MGFVSRISYLVSRNLRLSLTTKHLLLFVFLTFALSRPVIAADAETLYQAHCARCHGTDGKGDGPAHTMQRPWPRDFTRGEFKFRSTPLDTLPTVADLEKVIREGVLRTSMPPFEKFLSDEEIRALAVYVRDMARESGLPESDPVQPPSGLDAADPDAGRIAAGEALYRKFRCDSCHGTDGRGLGPLAGGLRDMDGFFITPVDLTDPLSYGGGSRASDVYTRLMTGMALSPMLNYSDVLTDEEAQNIALYVRSLQIPASERPAPRAEEWRGKLGPVPHGEYLTRAMTCALCHNSYDASGFYRPDLYLAGGVGIRLPGLGTFPTRNITSHPEYGIGTWTEEEVARVITTGHAPDRRIEAFAMPWVFFSHLDPEDARHIAAYVKTLPPIANEVPERTYDPFWKRLWTRLRQLLGMEYGRLEYPYGNVGVEHGD